MKYTSLFFDLDNTLLDFYKAEAVAIEKVLKHHSLPYDSGTIKLYSKINRSYWERFERGEIPKEAIYEGRFRTLFEELNCDGNAKSVAEDYFNALADGYFVMNGAVEILEYLKAKGYKIYATTNGVSFTQYKRIENSGLAPFFDKVFVSEDAGCQKPEKEYFEYVMNNIDEKDKSNILIIGDSQSSDILGGINSGIDTCWFNNEEKVALYKSRYEITNLKELRSIL